MAGRLKLEVVMAMVDKALAPLRGIDRQSKATADSLRTSRNELRALETEQDKLSGFRKQQAAVRELSNRLTVLRTNLATTTAAYGAASPQAAKLSAEVTKQNKEFDSQRTKLLALRSALTTAGVNNLTAAEASMGQRIAKTTAAINQQTSALKAQGEQQRKMAALKDAHGKAMARTAGMAGAGAAGLVTGRVVAEPVRASLGAYGDQENASTQLKASMMQADGSVSREYEKINELATRLGDRLPGTTAEFLEMMTMLKRQGLSAQSILGGTGEAAALLGVQLRMPVTEAAEFAAKMQDATRTTEGDMLGLMDTIQRTFYLGVDSDNMLQGFTKLSPVMGIIKKEGLEASNMLAPLLVMMDQTGMAGESAGNAIRKVFQGGFDAKKMEKANAELKKAKAGFSLDFTDGKGEFGGIEKMFAQLQKLQGLNTTQRTTVMKQIFGDDSETLQVLDTLMSKGLNGYNEVAAKMQAQADLRKRVDMQLGTLTNVVEAAQGTWTNVMASIGETIAPDAKALVGWLGEVSASVGTWIKAHPTLVAWLAKAAAVVAVLYTAISGLMLGLAGVMAPMLMVRFALRAIGVQGGMLSLVLRGLVASAGFLKGALLGVVRVLMANPIIAVIAAIAIAAYLIYQHWGAITSFFSNLWQTVKNGVNTAWKSITDALASAWHELLASAESVWNELGGSFPAVLQTIAEAIINWSPVGLFYQAFAAVMRYFGFDMPARFTEFGANIIQGLIDGILGGVQWVRNAVATVADSAIGWFKDKLGIHSPSRVFMEAGINVGEGAAAGIEGTQSMVRKSALAMATAAAVSLPAAAVGLPAADAMTAAINTAPAMSAQPAMSAVSPTGGSVSITINAAPGMDPKAIAAAVRAELLRIEADKRARSAGGFYDLNH